MNTFNQNKYGQVKLRKKIIVQIIGLRMASRFANFYFMFAWCLDPWIGRRRPYFLGRFCKCNHPLDTHWSSSQTKSTYTIDTTLIKMANIT